jgi:hypothetical protein
MYANDVYIKWYHAIVLVCFCYPPTYADDAASAVRNNDAACKRGKHNVAVVDAEGRRPVETAATRPPSAAGELARADSRCYCIVDIHLFISNAMMHITVLVGHHYIFVITNCY